MDSLEICKYLKTLSQFGGVLALDELPAALPSRECVMYIVNTQKRRQRGSHWFVVTIYKTGYGEVFDSLGPATANLLEIKSWMNKNCHFWKFNPHSLQGSDSVCCGVYSIFYVKYRNCFKSIEDFIHSSFDICCTRLNDISMYCFIK